jgi:RHS repeat-associated protein
MTAPDGTSTSTYSYSGNNTTTTDPAGKWKTQTTDAFGNLTTVTEPNPAGGNFTTSYSYSPLNQLLVVTMPRGSTTQTRTFTYNGRDMVSATNPENGTVSYTYDASHRVLTRTDAKNQQTKYIYSVPLGQLTQVQHGTVSNGTFTQDTTSAVNYTYDTYGRTSQVQFGAQDLNFARTFTYGYTYSTTNRVLSKTMGWYMYSTGGSGSPPTVAESFGMSYQWDNEGKMTSYTDVNTVQWSYLYDGVGRAASLTSQCMGYEDGQCVSQATAAGTYGSANQLLTLSYTPPESSSLNETRTYNSLLQLTNITASGFSTMNMTYNYPASNNGRIASSVDAVNSQTVNYTYDSLNRLTAAQATGGWGESYTYDGFGNLSGISPTGQGGETWSALINESTNRLQGVNYDANGNQIGDQVHTNYVWNVDNRMAQKLTPASGGGWYGGAGYSYDPSGRRVMKNVNADPAGTLTGTGYGTGTWEFYFYGLNGRKMATIDCTYNTGYLELCAVTGQNVYFAGKMIADGTGFVVTDRLGSVRANGNADSGNVRYFPYGAEQTATTEGMTKFGTYTRDAVGQDYADQRYYGSGTGSFFTADPSTDNVDYLNPTTWNAYLYENGDPVNSNDPSGLGPVTLPPVVPGTNCSTAFINYAAYLGETVQQFFDSDIGILGMMSYFEQEGSGTSSDQLLWAALDWTFVNQWNMSPADKALFYGPSHIPSSFAATVTTGAARSQVFTYTGQLTPGFTAQLLSILTGSPNSSQCEGLVDAFMVAQGVLNAANGTVYLGEYYIPDVIGTAVVFGSNGHLPQHAPYVTQTPVGTIQDSGNVWIFYGDIYAPPPPVRKPPRKNGGAQ